MYTKNLLTSFEELLRIKYTKYYSNKLFRKHLHKDNLFGLSKMHLDYEVGNIGLKINGKEKNIYNIETLFIAYVYKKIHLTSKVISPKYNYVGIEMMAHRLPLIVSDG
jgi:hypothetical protein